MRMGMTWGRQLMRSLGLGGVLLLAACSGDASGPIVPPPAPVVEDTFPAPFGASVGPLMAKAGEVAAPLVNYLTTVGRDPSVRRTSEADFLDRGVLSALQGAVRHVVPVYAFTLPGDSVRWQGLAIGAFEARPAALRPGEQTDSLAGLLLWKTTDPLQRIVIAWQTSLYRSPLEQIAYTGDRAFVTEQVGARYWSGALPPGSVRLTVLNTPCPRANQSINCHQLRIDVAAPEVSLQPDRLTTGAAPWRVGVSATVFGVHRYTTENLF